jgi:hypothetical protein
MEEMGNHRVAFATVLIAVLWSCASARPPAPAGLSFAGTYQGDRCCTQAGEWVMNYRFLWLLVTFWLLMVRIVCDPPQSLQGPHGAGDHVLWSSGDTENPDEDRARRRAEHGDVLPFDVGIDFSEAAPTAVGRSKSAAPRCVSNVRKSSGVSPCPLKPASVAWWGRAPKCANSILCVTASPPRRFR